MPKTPKRLYGPAALTVATLYTVPSVTKTVIRHIHIENGSAGALTFTLSIGADAAGTRLFFAQSVPAAAAGVTGNVVDYNVYWPMEAAEILVSSVASAMNIVVSGDEYTLG